MTPLMYLSGRHVNTLKPCVLRRTANYKNSPSTSRAGKISNDKIGTPACESMFVLCPHQSWVKIGSWWDVERRCRCYWFITQSQQHASHMDCVSGMRCMNRTGFGVDAGDRTAKELPWKLNIILHAVQLLKCPEFVTLQTTRNEHNLPYSNQAFVHLHFLSLQLA